MSLNHEILATTVVSDSTVTVDPVVTADSTVTVDPAISTAAAEINATSRKVSRVVPPDNILSDHNELLEQLNEIKSIIEDDPVPPAVFAREPSAADSYISLINAWKEAEDANVINITPASVKSVSQVASSLTVGGQWVQQSYNENSTHGVKSLRDISSVRDVSSVHIKSHTHSKLHTHSKSQVMYESDETYESDDETKVHNELEDKIDATYNKLCSLEITNSNALDAVHQVNGQLENIGRNSFTTSKQVRSTDEKVDKVATQVEKLSEQFVSIMSEIQSIKSLLVSIVRQNSTYGNRNYE